MASHRFDGVLLRRVYSSLVSPASPVVVVTESLATFFGLGTIAGADPWAARMRVECLGFQLYTVNAYSGWSEREFTIGKLPGATETNLHLGTLSRIGDPSVSPNLLASVDSGAQTLTIAIDETGVVSPIVLRVAVSAVFSSAAPP